ncbi:MAG: hypothetical protein IT370_00255 [Deltaproteobacteria bacterium]|nr:hypothetical protein [Deltaproteobacteria bacterium]
MVELKALTLLRTRYSKLWGLPDCELDEAIDRMPEAEFTHFQAGVARVKWLNTWLLRIAIVSALPVVAWTIWAAAALVGGVSRSGLVVLGFGGALAGLLSAGGGFYVLRHLHRVRVERAPRGLLHRIASFIWSPKTCSRYFDPIIADRDEQRFLAEAEGKRWQVKWIIWRARFDLILAMALQVPGIRLLWRLAESLRP